MSETTKIIITAIATTGGAFVVFIFSQIVSKWIIDPLHDFQVLLGRIDFSLDFYADVWSNPGLGSGERLLSAQQDLRELAMKLRTESRGVRPFSLVKLVRLIPDQTNIREASAELVGLSNGLMGAQQGEIVHHLVDVNLKRVTRIRELLDLHPSQP